MATELSELLEGLQPTQAADQEELVRLRAKGLPDDYVSFMKNKNGGFGFIGQKRKYIDLWTAFDVLNLNPYYQDDYAKRVACIGSDGGGMLYGYDVTSRNFLIVDPFEFNEEDVRSCGSNFFDLISCVANQDV